MNFILGIAIFVLGVVSGWFSRAFFEERAFHMTEQASKNFLIILITLTWAFAMLVSVSNPAYIVPLPVHGILGIIVGFFFAKPGQGGSK